MKNLIKILSTISFINITSISTISCNKKTNISLYQKENDIINAINQYSNKNTFKNYQLNYLSINDIIKFNTIIYKNNYFTYDLLLKNYSQSQNIISSKYKYLNPEIKGDFNIHNGQITNNKLNLLENLNLNYQNVLGGRNTLVGNTNDFIAIFNDGDWTNICNRILKNDHPVEFINSLGLKNPKINLIDSDWEKNILPSLEKYGAATVPTGYSFLMHVVNKQVVYSNLKKDGTNMPYADIGEFIRDSLFKINSSNYQFLLSKQLLFQLNDLFSYEKDNFNINEINSLINDKIWLTNCNVNDAITNLKLLFTNKENLNIIHKILNSKNYNAGAVINIKNSIASLSFLP